MPGLSTVEDILATELKSIHSAERQLTRVLPRLVKKVSSERLKELLNERQEQGEELIEKIEDALEEMDTAKSRAKNPAMQGLIEDSEEHVSEVKEERFLDAVLLAGMQKIEHYCIAAWGTAASLGRLLENEQVVDAMEHALAQGKNFDKETTQLAEDEINPAMMEGEEGETEGEDEEEEERPRRRRASR